MLDSFQGPQSSDGLAGVEDLLPRQLAPSWQGGTDFDRGLRSMQASPQGCLSVFMTWWLMARRQSKTQVQCLL